MLNNRPHNHISSKNQLDLILKNINDGNVDNLWTCKPYKDCFEKYNVDEISQNWNSKLANGKKLDALTIVAETLEYLMFPVLDEKITFYEYKKIVDDYSTKILNLDFDDIFTLSIKKLMEIGYFC